MPTLANINFPTETALIEHKTSNSWWHANHSEPGMKVYRSTLKHYSRPLLDFDSQIFSVTCGDP